MDDLPEEIKNQEVKIIKEPFDLGNKFLDQEGSISNPLVKGQKVTLLLFSGAYCPPCRSLLPKLIEFYNDANIIEKLIEIIYIPFDRNENEFQETFKQMPWISLPFNHTQSKKYAINYNIKGIPMLVAIKQNLQVITMEAKIDVLNCVKEQRDPEEEVNKWLKIMQQG